MADLSDVMDCLEQIALAQTYPNGTEQPSITTKNVTVGQGWPMASDVDAAMRAGASIVSVYAIPSSTGDAGQPLNQVFEQSRASAGLSVSTVDDTVTFEEAPNAGDVATIFVNGQTFSYSAVQGNASADVAAALFAQAHQVFSDATVSGSSLTFPSAYSLDATCGGQGILAHKTHRQRTQFQVVIWSPNPADRTTISRAIDGALKAQVEHVMPDQTVAIVTYQGTNLRDKDENDLIYRRDLILNGIYETIEEITCVEITNFGSSFTPNQ